MEVVDFQGRDRDADVAEAGSAECVSQGPGGGDDGVGGLLGEHLSRVFVKTDEVSKGERAFEAEGIGRVEKEVGEEGGGGKGGESELRLQGLDGAGGVDDDDG